MAVFNKWLAEFLKIQWWALTSLYKPSPVYHGSYLGADGVHSQKPYVWHCLAVWDISAGPSLTTPPTELPTVSFPSTPPNIFPVSKALFLSHTIIHFLPSLRCFSLAHSFFPWSRYCPWFKEDLRHNSYLGAWRVCMMLGKMLGLTWRENPCSTKGRSVLWIPG